jgi:hypothetical protein
VIKRRPKPDLTFKPVVVGDVHFEKERDGKGVVTTKCGLIVDKRSRHPVKTTIWNDYTCGDCLAARPLQRA